MKTVNQNYRVDRRHISMLRFIFEAYEGIAVVSTIKASQGYIALAIAPGCETLVELVIADLSHQFLIEPCEEFE